MKISQIGLVVADIKKTIDRYVAVQDIGPWNITSLSAATGLDLTVATVRIGEIELQLIEPGKEMSVYKEFLDKKGEGLHHLRVRTDTPEQTQAFLDHMQAENIPVLQQYTGPDCRVVSFDTWDELGLILEVADVTAGDPDAGSQTEVYPEDFTPSDNTHKMNIRQFAVVVKDARPYMDAYCRLLGVRSFDVRHFRPENMKSLHVEGVPQTEGFEFICAVAWLENLEIEVIQPIRGNNIYWEFLEERGEGFHHIKDVFPDEEIALETRRMEDFCIRIMQTGWIDGDSHYYMSTYHELKMIIEYGNGGKIGAPDYVYPLPAPQTHD